MNNLFGGGGGGARRSHMIPNDFGETYKAYPITFAGGSKENLEDGNKSKFYFSQANIEKFFKSYFATFCITNY
jgi:hypothetical protein